MEYFENLSDDELQKVGFDLQLVEFKKPFKPISRGRLLEKIRKLVEHSNDTLFLKTKIERIKKKRHASRKEEDKECHNESTSAGNETDALMDDQLYFYNAPGSGSKIIFCFDIDDINYVLSIKKNFHTNVVIDEVDLDKMREWKDNFIFEDVLNIDEAYDKIFQNVKVVETPEMKFQEKLRKMNEILSKHNPYTNALEMGILKLDNYKLFIESRPFGIVLKDHVTDSNDVFQVKSYVVEQILLMLQTNPDSSFLINKMIDDVVLMNNRKMTFDQLKEYRKEEGEEVYIEKLTLEVLIDHKLKDCDIEGLRVIFEDPNIKTDDYFEPVVDFVGDLAEDVDIENDENSDKNADFLKRVDVLRFLLNNPNFNAYLYNNEIYNLIVNMANYFVAEFGKNILSHDIMDRISYNMGLLLVTLDVNKPFYNIDLSIIVNSYLDLLTFFEEYDKLTELLQRDSKYDPSMQDNIIIRRVAYKEDPKSNKILKLLLKDKRVDPSVNDNILVINVIKNGDIKKVKLFYKALESKYNGKFPRNVINAVIDSKNKEILKIFKFNNEIITITLPKYIYRINWIGSGKVKMIHEIPSFTLNVSKTWIETNRFMNPLTDPKIKSFITIGSKEFYDLIKPPDNHLIPPMVFDPSPGLVYPHIKSLENLSDKSIEHIIKNINALKSK
jgi:hypothetical protein